MSCGFKMCKVQKQGCWLWSDRSLKVSLTTANTAMKVSKGSNPSRFLVADWSPGSCFSTPEDDDPSTQEPRALSQTSSECVRGQTILWPATFCRGL